MKNVFVKYAKNMMGNSAIVYKATLFIFLILSFFEYSSFEYLGADHCQSGIYYVLSTYSSKESDYSCKLFHCWICPNTWLLREKKLEDFQLKFGKVGLTLAKLGLKRKSSAAVSSWVQLVHKAHIFYWTSRVSQSKTSNHRALPSSVSHIFINMFESFCLQEKKRNRSQKNWN